MDGAPQYSFALSVNHAHAVNPLKVTGTEILPGHICGIPGMKFMQIQNPIDGIRMYLVRHVLMFCCVRAMYPLHPA